MERSSGVAAKEDVANSTQRSSIVQGSVEVEREKKLIRRKSELPKEMTTVNSLENYRRADEYLNSQPESAS